MAKLSSKVAAVFCIPPAMNETSQCSTSSSAFGIVSVSDYRCVLVPHCCFNLKLMVCDVEHLYICLFAVSISSLVRCLFRFSAPLWANNWVVFLLLSFKRSLYILDTIPLSVICFANIFS